MVKVFFQPKMAGLHNAVATCWFGGEVKQKRTIQLKALGEYFLHLTYKEMCVISNSGIPQRYMEGLHSEALPHLAQPSDEQVKAMV